MLNKRILAVPTVVGLLAFGGGALAGATLGTVSSPEAAANSVAPGAVTASAPVMSAGLASTTITNPECATPNQVNNGDFSQPGEGSGSRAIFPAKPAWAGQPVPTIPCWTVGGDSVGLAGHRFFQMPKKWPSGWQAVDLSGEAPGSISQTISTKAGSSYELSWQGAPDPGCGKSPKVMDVWWDGKLMASPRYPYPIPGFNASDVVWAPGSLTVVATGARSALKFADASPDKSMCGAVVADVSLTVQHLVAVQNLVVNGNFSQPQVTRGTSQVAGQTTIEGWTVGGSKGTSVVLESGSRWGPPTPPVGLPGSQSVDLSRAAPGSITQYSVIAQLISTTPGASYLLKWYAGVDPTCPQTDTVMEVTWLANPPKMTNPGTAITLDVDVTAGFRWNAEDHVVTASSDQMVLSFADTPGEDIRCGPVVADVSLWPQSLSTSTT